MPIDPNFQKKRKKVGKEKGIAIWGPVDSPEKLGIRGTNVAVDWDACEGCGICLEVCPVQLYEWRETSGHPTSEKKAFPAREIDCVQCYTCETQCPAQAIKVIFRPPDWETAVNRLMLSQSVVGNAMRHTKTIYWQRKILSFPYRVYHCWYHGAFVWRRKGYELANFSKLQSHTDYQLLVLCLLE